MNMTQLVRLCRLISCWVLLLAVGGALMLSSCDEPKPEVIDLELRMYFAGNLTTSSIYLYGGVVRTPANRDIQLTYLCMHYDELDGTIHKVDVTERGDGGVHVNITGLKPNTTYNFYLEGGTATARMVSDVMKITTFPNSVPKVEPAKLLCQGPTGLTVSFVIADNGGEPITEAGCELREGLYGTGVKYPLSADSLKPGTYTLYLRNLTKYVYEVCSYATNSVGTARSESVTMSTGNGFKVSAPGHLAELIKGETTFDRSSLSVAGLLNGSDFRALRTLLGAPAAGGSDIKSSLTDLNLDDVTITEGGEPYDGSRFTVANVVTTGMFADCPQLRDLSLPQNAVSVERDAFARSEALNTLFIPNSVQTIVPSAGCTSLTFLYVNIDHPTLRVVNRLLLNRQGDAIVWIPQGIKGDLTIPSTITSIGENAFAGTAITSVTIPNSVKTIARGAFADSKLKTITLPDAMTNIAESLFQNSPALTEVHLGSGVEFVGNYAFDVPSLRHLYIGASFPPVLSADAFGSNAEALMERCTLHVPKGRRAIYRNHARWGQFAYIEEY